VHAAAFAAWACVPALIVLVATAGGGHRPLTPAQKRAERADVGGPFPLELRSPQVVAGTSQRVLVALGRPSVGELMAQRRQAAADQRAHVRSIRREARALMSALRARGVQFGDPLVFARVWSGFAATIATEDLPAVQTLGLRVEPVSRFYPAQVEARDAPGVRPLPAREAGGRVAVLDAFPRGTVEADVVGRSGARRLRAERAGLRLAGVVGQELPRARVVPIRAAGAQPLEDGTPAVFATTDQLFAALERAVDPDQDGDATDAVPVALTGLSAPYSGFPDSAAAEAVDAAAALGTLVVAPAGNGGRAEGPFGTIGDPGAAAAALTVGALDGSGKPAPATSRGPTYAFTPKPDLAIGGGAATTAGAGWGTAIAAARVAGVAAALRAARPELSPAETAAALIGTAAARGDPALAGGGDPLLQAARATQAIAEPPQLLLRPGQRKRVRIEAPEGRVPQPHRPSAPGLEIRASGGGRVVEIGAPRDARAGSGRIEVGTIAIPYQVVTAPPPSPPLGGLRIVRSKRAPGGVRFTLGSIGRVKDRGIAVVPVGNLVLTLEGPGRRELTPPGGARDLLPGEYAYTLTDEVLGALPAGRYRFVLRARGSAGGPLVSRRSRFFRIR
jgi:hypothetical protein